MTTGSAASACAAIRNNARPASKELPALFVMIASGAGHEVCPVNRGRLSRGRAARRDDDSAARRQLRGRFRRRLRALALQVLLDFGGLQQIILVSAELLGLYQLADPILDLI